MMNGPNRIDLAKLLYPITLNLTLFLSYGAPIWAIQGFVLSNAKYLGEELFRLIWDQFHLLQLSLFVN